MTKGLTLLRLRLLLVLCSLAFALAVVLARPLPSRAAEADPSTPTPPDPTPANANPVVPPLPLMTVEPIRRPAAVGHHAAIRHHAFHLAFGQRVVKYARHLLGVPYTYGGASPRSGFDCSGFVRYVYGHFGISLAHSSFSQFLTGRRVSRESLKPGDLVFFDGVGHVGIYVGNGRFIHAPHTGTRVEIDSLNGWYGARYDGARRLHTSA